MFAFGESKKTSDNSMTPIQDCGDVSIFKSRIVAFKTTSEFYFGLKQGFKIKDPEIRYALIGDEPKSYRNRNGKMEDGYTMYILINRKDIASQNILIDDELIGANMQMRFASKNELLSIKEAISKGTARFEYQSFRMEALDNLFDDEIRKLDNQSIRPKR